MGSLRGIEDMEKLGMLKTEKMGSYELERGFASYRTIIECFIGDIVLCNNIAQVDDSVYENLNIEERYYNENDEEITEDEYFNGDNAYCDNSIPDIYQFYLCNVSSYEEEQLKNAGVLLSYSDMLECDVLCVDHFGTSWDYVLTDVKLFDTYEELKAYENEDEEEEEDGEMIPLF